MPVGQAIRKFGAAVREEFHSIAERFVDSIEPPPPAYRTDNSCYERPSTQAYPRGEPYVSPEKKRPFRLGSVYIS